MTHHTSATIKSYFFPVGGVVLTPFIVAFVKPEIFDFLFSLIYIIIFVAPVFLIFKIVWGFGQSQSFFGIIKNNISIFPPGMIYNTDLEKKRIPYITILLILSNTVFYYMLSGEAVAKGVFFPYGNPSLSDCIISVFTSAFLHASPSHLYGNMILLWVAGNALEPRLGSFKFSLSYVFCIITTKVFVLIMLVMKAGEFDGFSISSFHSLGASGAISGLIGIFAVRCFFARLSVGLPIFFLPVFSMPIRVHATFLIGLFFAVQIEGSETQFNNNYCHINYWAHVGGYMGGFLLALILNMNATSAKEYTKVTAKRNGESEFGHKNAKSRYTEILKRDPKDEQALRYLLSKSLYDKLSAEKYYSKLIAILSSRDIKKAMVLFYTYFPNYTRAIDGMSLTRIGIQCYKVFDFHAASVCLEFASEKQGPWQSKALYQLGILHAESGDNILASNCFKTLIDVSDDSQFKKEAEKRMKKYVSQC